MLKQGKYDLGENERTIHLLAFMFLNKTNLSESNSWWLDDVEHLSLEGGVNQLNTKEIHFTESNKVAALLV